MIDFNQTLKEMFPLDYGISRADMARGKALFYLGEALRMIVQGYGFTMATLAFEEWERWWLWAHQHSH